VLAAERVSVPLPDLVRVPLPLMLPERVSEPVRSTRRAELLTMEELVRLPVPPPAPIWRVPAEMVVVPE